MSSSGRSSHARLRDAISTDRARIKRGERPTYHVAWAIAVDGSIDVTVRELPLIHQFVPDEASVLDGARFLIARTLEVGPDLFDVTGGSG
ncbi:MAG TPA: hypothetical protein VFM38_10245 [Candidatus Limnocylindrales bacterium]|nr:hypothetical protein [Candidatus Limnocylindrales bacterium]